MENHSHHENLEAQVREVLADRPGLKLAFGDFKPEFAKSRRHTTQVAWATVGGVFAAIALVIGAATAWQAASFSALAENMTAVEAQLDVLAELRGVR